VYSNRLLANVEGAGRLAALEEALSARGTASYLAQKTSKLSNLSDSSLEHATLSMQNLYVAVSRLIN
jgi:hypothetical protein